LGLGALLISVAGPAAAQQSFEDKPAIVRDTFGEVGILDMPSAHMAPDGAISFTAAGMGRSQRYNLTIQRKEWSEGTFRYARISSDPQDWDRSAGAKVRVVSESDTWPDVSIGIRNLIGTGQYDAEYLVASKHFGPLDLTAGLGWGRLSSGDPIANPLGLVFASYKTRPGNSGGIGGTLRFAEYFHGRAGVFGGAIWDTPIENLQFLVEYSSDHYVYEAAKLRPFKVRSPINVGLYYRPAQALSLSAGWMYGTTYGVTLTVTGDATTTYPSAVRIGPAVPPPAIRTDSQQKSALTVMSQNRTEAAMALRTGQPWVVISTPAERARQDLRQTFLSFSSGVRDVEVSGAALVVDAQIRGKAGAQCSSLARLASVADTQLTSVAVTDLQDPSGQVVFCSIDRAAHGDASQANEQPTSTAGEIFRQKLRADLAGQAIRLDSVSVGSSELWVYYENYRYSRESEAFGRVIRVLMADAPPSVEIFHIVATHLGIPMQELTVARSAMERAYLNRAPASSLGNALAFSLPPLYDAAFRSQVSDLYPHFTWGIDPKVTERLFDPEQPLQWMVYADVAGLLQIAPGLLLTTQLTGTIWTNYTFNRDPGSVLPHVRTDILKYLKQGKYGIEDLSLEYRGRVSRDVFGSVRAGYFEDMYMGAGAQLLWRPEGSRFAVGADIYQVWKRDFDRLFGYQKYNVVTGHVSIYYESPWNGLNFELHGGRYLAGDYGATFQITRRFSTGVEVGAWATFTNVPFSRFGEGSFDKGIIIHIPFEWGLPIYSQASYNLYMHSLTRDGGQRMIGDDSLYGVTRRRSYGDVTEHLEDIVAP
jgi:hypothetical protein